MKGILAVFALFFAALLLLGCVGPTASTPTEKELEELEAGLDEVDSLESIYGEDVGVDSGLAGELAESTLDEDAAELNSLDISVGDEYDSLDVDTVLTE